jgi:hypothetical protein
MNRRRKNRKGRPMAGAPEGAPGEAGAERGHSPRRRSAEPVAVGSDTLA